MEMYNKWTAAQKEPPGFICKNCTQISLSLYSNSSGLEQGEEMTTPRTVGCKSDWGTGEKREGMIYRGERDWINET